MPMPSYIFKPDRDKDFYVLWSDVTESPLMWGSLETMRAEWIPVGDLLEPF